jgi:hypothetical protein
MTGKNIWRLCKVYGRLIGCPTLKPHDLRHGVAMEVLEQHHDFEEVRALLGHARIDTTQVRTCVWSRPRFRQQYLVVLGHMRRRNSTRLEHARQSSLKHFSAGRLRGPELMLSARRTDCTRHDGSSAVLGLLQTVTDYPAPRGLILTQVSGLRRSGPWSRSIFLHRSGLIAGAAAAGGRLATNC